MSQFGKQGLARRSGRALAIALLFVSLVGVGKPAQASSLNLTLQSAPDMFSDAIDVSYDSASQTLTASGFAEHIKNGTDEPIRIMNGRFEITAKVTNTGDLVSGAMTITGEVPELGVGPVALLVGNLDALGGDAGGIVEFQFATNGGALAYQFGPVINVILGQSGFAGSFAQNFSNGAAGVAGIGW